MISAVETTGGGSSIRKGVLKPAVGEEGAQMALTPRPARGAAQPTLCPSVRRMGAALRSRGDSERVLALNIFEILLGFQMKNRLPSKPNGSLVETCAFPLGSKEKLISLLSVSVFVLPFVKWKGEVMMGGFL